jgi:N-acylglucosamine-6-phosphate 2-epimerase
MHEQEQTYRDYVTDQLIAFNAAQCASMRDDQRTAQPLGIVLLDANGDIVGGLFGSTQWDWLHIGVLWVAEALRGRGYGTRLVRKAEREARRRGCCHARVGTFSFQAKDFYERPGYRVVGQLDGYPPGRTDYLLRKDFGPEHMEHFGEENSDADSLR